MNTVYTIILYNKIAQYRLKNISVACVKVKKAGKAAPPKTIDNGGTKKRHGRTICDKGQCDVRLKIIRNIEAFPPIVTIERLDENTHSHTLGRSRELAPSELTVKIAGQEGSKGYTLDKS
jgi:hypothetical protein